MTLTLTAGAPRNEGPKAVFLYTEQVQYMRPYVHAERPPAGHGYTVS